MTFGVFENEYSNLESELDRAPGATEKDTPADFGDVHQAAFNLVVSEEQTSSRDRYWNPELGARYTSALDALGIEGRRDDFDKADHATAYMRVKNDPGLSKEINRLFDTGAVTYDPVEDKLTANTSEAKGWVSSGGLISYNRYLKAVGLLRAAREANPALEDDEQITATITEKTRIMREQSQAVMERAKGGTKAALFTGSALGAVTDPVVLATLPLGAPATAAKAPILMTAARAALLEAGIAGGVEAALVQPSVYSFKKEIGSPWGFKDAALNTMAAALGAGGLRFAGEAGARGLKKALTEYKKKVGEDPLTKDVEQYISETEQTPLGPGEDAEAAHVSAINKAAKDLEEGHTADVDGIVEDYLPEDTARAAPQGIESIPAAHLDVDAETFQYKSGANAAGVTERLQGVTEWDERLAGISIFYENKDGKLFVVDGHQRLGLARRLEAEGHEPIQLNGYRLREADGITPAEARSIAAVKNIAEGTGRALDAAKILRETGDLSALPQLPPRSSLVQQAQGLARLSDDVFMQVVNEVIPERYGAILGQVISDPAEQAAAVKVLARTRPDNAAQARSIIEQVRAAGFERTVTEDLFGEKEIAESLFKEKAKVIDAAAARIRKDKAVFQNLVDNQTRIETNGRNVLDHVANMENLSDAQKALQAITRLAYTAGPVSQALDRAARGIKAGGRLSRVLDDFISRVTDAAPLDAKPGVNAGAAGPAGETYTVRRKGPAPGVKVPRVGEPVKLTELPPPQRIATEKQFRESQAGKSLDDIYQVAEQHQQALAAIGDRVASEIPGVQFKNPGIKDKAGSAVKMKRKGYQDAKQLTDIVRGGFLVDTPDAAERVLRVLYDELEVLDEGWSVTPAGYIDRKALVRFEDGTIGEVQIWEPHIFEVKRGRGHKLYEEARALEIQGKIKPGKEAEWKRLNQEAADLYGKALREAGQAWEKVASPTGVRSTSPAGKSGKAAKKSSLSKAAPESRTSLGDTQVQGPPSLRTAAAASPSSKTTAGRPSQSTKAETRSKSISDTSTESITGSGDISHKINARLDESTRKAADPFADDPDLAAVADRQVAEARALLDDSDIDLPDEIRVQPSGDEELVVRSGREAMDELDEQEQALRRLITCIGD